jgi:hypothetical protein
VLIADPERAGTALNTLIVADLDRFLAGARKRGIEPGPIEPVGEGMRQSVVTDLDGNRLKVAAAVSDAETEKEDAWS